MRPQSVPSWFNNFKQSFRLKQAEEGEPKVFNKLATSYGERVTVVPGRESHTGNPQELEEYLKKMEEKKNDLNCEISADSMKFWEYVRSVVENATVLTGFEGDPDRTAVVPKGPEDYQRFFRKKQDTEIINPINPVAISAASGVPVSVVLAELLFATKAGLVSMKWAPFCERCTAPMCTMDWDNEPPVESFCQGCRYENAIECMSKIKVFFVLSQDVFYVLAENFQCTASNSIIEATEAKIHLPASSSGSGWRIFVGCGGDMEYRPKLPRGLYRMHCPIVPTQNYLHVKRDAKDDEEPCTLQIHHSKLVVRPGDKLTTLTVPHGKVHFDIFPDTMSEWIFWIHQDMEEQNVFYLPPDERKKYLTAFDVLDHPTFQLLFQDQTDAIIYEAVSQMKVNN